MPISIDIKKDYLYNTGIKKGIEEGIEKGREEGLEKGLEKGREEGLEKGLEKGLFIAVSNIIKKHPHFSDEEIAELVGVEVGFVARVRAER